MTIAKGLDGAIPGTGYLYKQGRNIKATVDRVERLSNELAENGDKVSSRRGLFKKAFRKAAVEGSKKPPEPLNTGKGGVQRTKELLDNASGNAARRRTVKLRGAEGERLNQYFRNSNEPIASEKGQVGRGINRLRRWLKYKSGNL